MVGKIILVRYRVDIKFPAATGSSALKINLCLVVELVVEFLRRVSVDNKGNFRSRFDH